MKYIRKRAEYLCEVYKVGAEYLCEVYKGRSGVYL